MVFQGDNVDITHLSFKPRRNIQVLKGRQYIHIRYDETANKIYSDGEVHAMADTNERNKRSLRKIFVDLRQLIATNFNSAERERQLMLTLTYRENVTDHVKVYKDWELFWRKFQRRYCKGEYIIIVEPQARGAWHIHALIKGNKALFPEAETVDDWKEVGKQLHPLWANGFDGFVYPKRLNNVDNVGAYFMAYFSRLEIPDNELHLYPAEDIKEVPTDDGRGKKKVVKGLRLSLYPDYMRIYRNSRGVKKPEKRILNSWETEYDAYIRDYPRIGFEVHTVIPVDELGNEMHIISQQRKKEKGG
jgi:hypothetical protein